MTMSNWDVISNWACRNRNGKGKIYWASGNVTGDGRFLWSYNTIIAVYLGVRDGERWFLKNGDTYSITTSIHQSNVLRCCKNGATVSFEALLAAGVSPRDLGLDNIVHYKPTENIGHHRHKDDTERHTGHPYEEKEHIPFEQPVQGMRV